MHKLWQWSALFAGSLAACSSANVGEGTKPVELFLGVGQRQASLSLDECAGVQLGAYVRFDGQAPSIGDYSGRVQFQSSDPTTAFIGDGVSRTPDGQVPAPGTLLAIKPGLATISATYLEFSATIAVQVERLGELRIEPALTDIAQDLPQKFELIATFSDARPEQDASESAVWRFEPATARASVDAVGAVQANSAGEGEMLSLIAQLPECGREARASFRVSPLAAVDLEYEFGDDNRLPLGTSELVTVLGRFAGAGSTRQNLSALAGIDNAADDFISVSNGDSIPGGFATANLRDRSLIVTAMDNPEIVAFDIHIPSGEGFDIRTRSWRLLDLLLDEVSVQPEELRVTYPGEGRLHAMGIFSNGMVRDISRHVVWNSADPAAAAVTQATQDAGTVTVADVDRDVEVEAYAEEAEVTSSARAQVRVFSSASTSGDDEP
ncbi:MAG: hypothetical protein ACT4PZ_02185 [Panacagrimonas sp.]